ncbi:MAG: cytochrome c [Bacteriovoracaceae bacterium]
MIFLSCNKNHRDQISYKHFEFSQDPPAHTIPIGMEEKVPEINLSSLKEGQKIFERTCIPCHGLTGEGDGIVTKKGLTPPPSYLEERLLKAPIEYFVKIMTFGEGRMPSYQRRLELSERYKVAYYIKALQLSRKIESKKLTPFDKSQLP